MGWFDDQIKQRIENDDEAFAQAFAEMAGAVVGKNLLASALRDARRQTRDAVEEILQYYHIPAQELPDKMQDMNEILEYLLRPSGIMRRNVELKDKWYKNGVGPLLAQLQDETVVAMIPSKISGYVFTDPETGKKIKVDKKQSQRFLTEAVAFYKPFPLRALTPKDLVLYINSTLSIADYCMIALATLSVTLIGMLSAYANNIVFSRVVPSGRMNLFYPALILLVGIAVSTQLINVVKNLAVSRIHTKSGMAVQAAAMMRTLSLPASFFKTYSAGDLASRVRMISGISDLMLSVIFSTGLSAVFSLSYFVQIFHYAPALALPAICILLITVLFFSISAVSQMKSTRELVANSAKESGLVYSLLSGIQKIKLSGAEKRAFAKWANVYKDSAKLQYRIHKEAAYEEKNTRYSRCYSGCRIDRGRLGCVCAAPPSAEL